jgi:hypothetical protein
MHHPVRRAISRALLASCLLLVLGGGVAAQVATLEDPAASPEPGAGAGPSDAPTSDDPQEAMLAFAQCMRDHGIDMDDPQFGEGGRGVIMRIGGRGGPDVDPEGEEFRTAQESCASELGLEGGPGLGGPPPGATP